MTKKKKIPPNAVQANITAIFNNLNQINFKKSCNEIQEIMIDNYWPWAVQYLITKCVSVKLNSHLLYYKLFYHLKNPEVHKMVVQETHKYIQLLLQTQNDEKSMDFFDRSLLQNLGHWLGIITLKQNKPILLVDIDIKGLLLDAYHKSQRQLLYIVPFVAKILVNCVQSRIFRPPNPWTMSIINILIELYHNLNITSTTKLEIEAVCKTLNINITKFQCKNYLKNSEKLRPSHELSNGHKEDSNQTCSKQFVETALVRKEAFEQVLPIHTIPVSSTIFRERFVIDNQLPLFQVCPHLKKLVRPTIEQIIRQWVPLVTQKTLQITSTMTEHIMHKNFTGGLDVNQMKIAARQMVGTLTAGIAMKDYIDGIFISISNNLKQVFVLALTESYQSPKYLIDQAINIIAANNLELVCAFVQKSAIDQAKLEIDRKLYSHSSRKYHFSQEAINQGNIMLEQTQLPANGVAPQHMTVYKEFEKTIFNLLFINQTSTVSTVNLHPRIDQESDHNDNNSILLKKTKLLQKNCLQIRQSFQNLNNSIQYFEIFIQQMHDKKIFEVNYLFLDFLKKSIRICLDYYYSNVDNSNEPTTNTDTECLSYFNTTTRLITLFVKYFEHITNISTKIDLLNKILKMVIEDLFEDHKIRDVNFQQMPYYHIFNTLLRKLCALDPFVEIINYQVLISFCDIFYTLRPEKASRFSSAWLDLISDRVFIGRILALTPTFYAKCQELYARLLTGLFTHLASPLRLPMISASILMLYERTLHVLVMLLKHFPQVLSDHYYKFCDILPLNCLQMKNIILSAIPKNLKLSDLSALGIKMKMPPEMGHALCTVQPMSFKATLNLYLMTQTPDNFITELKNRLYGVQPGMHYNVKLINDLVLYLGVQAMDTLFYHGHILSIRTVKNSIHLEIFHRLLKDLDTDGRYLLLSSIINHLRYANVCTHYFSYTVRCLFIRAESEVVKEQIIRVLLERLTIPKPYPWGLLITFTELMKNPIYEFWSYNFVHSASNFEKLLKTVMRSFDF